MRVQTLSLSDRQMTLVQNSARSLPQQQRDRYLRSIADQLVGEPSDAAVVAAINVALDRVFAFQQYESKEQTA
jgi:hypothetical protein